MPESPQLPCRAPGCRTVGPCPQHDIQRGRLERERKPSWSGWYHIARWRNPVWGLRARVLAASPLCVVCRATGRIVAATEVDHVQPHRGDPALFWNIANCQGLCWTCHQNKTNRGE
jgi:5-methylcytosine-specific restriction enzyme A